MAEKSGIRVVLSDDHALVRQGFRRILEDEPGITVVGEGGNGAQAVELARTHKPDVVVLDMAMPDMNGVQAARMILRERPQTRVLILSMYADEQYVRSALDATVTAWRAASARLAPRRESSITETVTLPDTPNAFAAASSDDEPSDPTKE